MRKGRVFLTVLAVAVVIGAIFAFNISRESMRAETVYYSTTTTTAPGIVYVTIPCVVGEPNNCPFPRPYYRKVGASYVLYTGPAMFIGE